MDNWFLSLGTEIKSELEFKKTTLVMPEGQLSDIDCLTLLENLTSGALLADQNGVIRYANPAFCHLLNDTAVTQLQGLKLSDLLTLPPKTDCALCIGKLKLDHTLHAQWATFHGGFLHINKRENGVTEELRIKIKHSRLTSEAPTEDAHILCLIDRFSEDTTLTQAHSDFVSTVSHEFRTPLTSIKGFADTLLAYGKQLSEDEQRRFISIIKDQADRLIRMVENLLTASKLGAGRVEMSYRPVPVKRLFDKVIQSILAKSSVKNSKPPRFDILVTPTSLEVWADADRLEQILLNLLDNAVKYSPDGKTVHVKAEFLPEDDTLIRIMIRDEGAGIPKDLLPKIFTKFYRIENPLKQEVEGTGLGLYITQSLTTAMNGRILAESEPGQGSLFTLIFPAATLERQATYRRKLYASEDNA